MLTMTQRKTLQFIEDFIIRHTYAPTTAEIAKGIGIKSRGVVHRYLRALNEAGHIAMTPKRHRNIRLKRNLTQTTTLPLVGVIAAGCPIEAIEQHESIDVADVFLGDNRYMLRVKGVSMIEEGIFDGDLVVCEKSQTAETGQIVVALIDQQEATLKRVQHNQDHTITLLPANANLKPMVYAADRVEIQGIFIGLLRFAR